MTYELAIGDRSYSSWSLRGWLLFAAFDIPVSVRSAFMYTDGFPKLLEEFAPARLVPAAKLNGQTVWDSLALAEELATRHPDAGLWPSDPAARAMARSLTAEMHSGFTTLRSECTMNLLLSYPDFKPSDALLAELARLETLWGLARSTFGANGPWLFGQYSIADAFYAPVATRLSTYHLPRSAVAGAYIDAHLSHTPFRQWRAMGVAQNRILQSYLHDLPEGPWQGPAPLAAKPVERGPSVNAKCPYSGKAPTDFLELDGKVYGFCNPFCRDKTVADAEAWPPFMDIVQR